VEGMPALKRGQKRNKSENGMILILKNAQAAARVKNKLTRRESHLGSATETRLPVCLRRTGATGSRRICSGMSINRVKLINEQYSKEEDAAEFAPNSWGETLENQEVMPSISLNLKKQQSYTSASW
jgi:hypothetical protein